MWFLIKPNQTPMLTKLRKQLNDYIARRFYEKNLFFVSAIAGTHKLIYGYAPIYSVLCRCIVDISRPDGIILARPIPWWQYTFLKTEQSIFYTISRKEQQGFINTSQGKVPAVQIQETGIWFNA